MTFQGLLEFLAPELASSIAMHNNALWEAPVHKHILSALTAREAFILRSIAYPTIRFEHTSFNTHMQCAFTGPMLSNVGQPDLAQGLDLPVRLLPKQSRNHSSRKKGTNQYGANREAPAMYSNALGCRYSPAKFKSSFVRHCPNSRHRSQTCCGSGLFDGFMWLGGRETTDKKLRFFYQLLY